MKQMHNTVDSAPDPRA